MGTYLIDTNIIADYLGGRIPQTSLEQVHSIIDSNPFTSLICKIETLSYNFPDDELLIAQSFFNYLNVINLSDDIVNETISIRRNYRIKTPDAIIAATAKINSLTLVTRNTKDFDKIHDLKLYNPWL